MKWNKTWFDYLIWMGYTVFSCIYLAAYVIAACVMAPVSGMFLMVGIVCLVFLLTAALYLAGRKTAGRYYSTLMKDGHLRDMLEWFMVLGLSAAGLLYRVGFLFREVAGLTGDLSFFEAAAVKASQSPAPAHGASFLYTGFLSFVFSFLGNKPVAGIILEVVLQLSFFFLLYFSVRLLCGRIAAVSAAAAVAFFPAFTESLSTLTPECFFLVLCGLLLLVCALYLHRSARAGVGRAMSLIVPFLLGLLAGGLLFLDIQGSVFVLFVALALFLQGEKRDGWRKGAIQAGLALLGSAVGMTAACAAAGGGSPAAGFIQWASFYPVHFTGAFLKIRTPVQSYLLLGLLSILLVPGFWNEKSQKSTPWMLMLAGAGVVLPMLGVGVLREGLLFVSLLSVCGGLGLQSLTIPVKSDDEDRQEEEKEKEDGDWEELSGDGASEPAGEEPKPVKFIENPLPVPKRHVKKEMDYDREIPADDDFDVDVPADDDFDIRE